METKTVGIWGVYFEVEYYFQPGEKGDREYPGCNPQWEIEAIYIGSENVYDHLSAEVLNLIEEKLCE